MRNRKNRREIVREPEKGAERKQKRSVLIACAAAPIAAMLGSTAEARVQLSSVASGAAQIAARGSVTTIRTTNNSILYFSQFNIAAGSTVDFIQPSAVSRVLDHVTSATPSRINGTLESNGIVYLVNPAGIIFGPNSVVNVNQLVAAASTMADQDFLNNVDHFTNVSGIVSSAGKIEGNQVSLIGSQVINSGSIVAPNGVVEMLAGTDVYVSEQGSHVTAQVSAPVQKGSTSPAAPTDNLSAMPFAAGDVYSLAIRHTGDIQAGNVLINGAGGQVQISGTINASTQTPGGVGGTVAITGGEVNLTSATITASGPAGGGTVEIGGGPHSTGDLAQAQYVSLDSNTTINADATNNGTGGSLSLWSAAEIDCGATLTARGGPSGGDGGTIDTSGEIVNVSRAPDESAPNGKFGTWQLDPLNIEIVEGPSNGETLNFGGQSTIFNGTIDQALDLGNVIISTNQAGTPDTGTLTQDSNAPIQVQQNNDSMLTLQANSAIDLSGGITVVAGAAGKLSVEIDEFGGPGNAVKIDTNSININGTLTFQGGDVEISTNVSADTVMMTTSSTALLGSVTIGSPVQTGPGGFSMVGGTSFTLSPGSPPSAGGTITTSEGPVVISPGGPVNIGAAISTNGGTFTSHPSNDSSSFTSTAAINTDGGEIEIILGGNGPVAIEAAVSSGDADIIVTGTSFTNSGTGTITTTDGSVGITTSGSVSIEAAITTGGGDVAIDPGAVTISAPISTGGGNYSVSAGASFTTNTGSGPSTTGTVTTHGGSVDVTVTGTISVGAAINSVNTTSTTSPGGPITFSGSSFASITGGTITTGGGNVDIEPTGAGGTTIGAAIDTSLAGSTGGSVDLDAPGGTPGSDGPTALSATINTGGGAFAAGGSSFVSNASATITTGGGSVEVGGTGTVSVGAAISSVNTTSTTSPGGAITFSGASFTSITGGTITSGGGDVDIEPTGAGGATIGAAIDTSLTGSTGGFVHLDAPGGTPGSNGPTALNAPINTGGGGFAAGGSSFVSSTAATITTGGGSVDVGGTGTVSVGAAINSVNTTSTTSPGGAITFSGSSFTSVTGGTITSGGGDVEIELSGPILIQAEVDTGGGTFTATGTGFENDATITNGSTSPPNAALTINTTSGTGAILINSPIAWSGGAGSSILIEGGADVTFASGAAFQITGSIPVEIDTVGTGSIITFESVLQTSGPLHAEGGNIVVSPTGQITAQLVAFNTFIPFVGKPGVLGSVTLSGPVVTSDGDFTSGGTGFTSSGNGTITTQTGNVSIATTGEDTVGASINTNGGTFTATGTGFTNTATITDGSSAPANAALTINTTSGNGPIVIAGPIDWSGGAGGSILIEGGDNVTFASTGAFQIVGTFAVEIDTVGSGGIINIEGALLAPGPFIADGGEFVVSPTGKVAAESVTLNTAAKTVGGKTGVLGFVSLGGPVTTTFGGFVSGGTSFTSNGLGTVTTNTGGVTIQSSGQIDVGANITTNGGAFVADGAGFENTAVISDGGVVGTTEPGVSITTTTDDIVIDGDIDWSASLTPVTLNPAVNRSVELDANITANKSEAVDLDNGPVILTGPNPVTISGGNLAIGVVSTVLGGATPDLTLQSGSTVVLQTIGSTAQGIGSLTVQDYPSTSGPAPATILNGNIYTGGNITFAGTVTLEAPAAGVTIEAGVEADPVDPIITFGAAVEGPRGLTVIVPGNPGDEITFNGNLGDVTTLAFLNLRLGEYGVADFSYGDGPVPPTPSEVEQATTVDIASGGSVQINYEPDGVTPARLFPSAYASVGSYSSLAINIGDSKSPNPANLFEMGRNEKITTYGSLTIDTNGGTARIGDLNTSANLNVFSPNVTFLLRQPTYEGTRPIDAGLDLVANGAMNFLPGATISIDQGPAGDSFDTPAFMAANFFPGTVLASIERADNVTFGETPLLGPASFFGDGDALLDLTPTSVSVSLPNLIPPISFVFDLPIAGAVPRDDLIAGAVPRDMRRVRRQVVITPSLKDQLNQAEIFPRDPASFELVDAVQAYADYDDVPQTQTPQPEDYRVVVNRIDFVNAQRFIDNYFATFRGEGSSNMPGGSRAAKMQADIDKAWNAYTHNGAKVGTGAGFQQYCASTPSARDAYTDLAQLQFLLAELDSLGLTNAEERNAADLKLFPGLSARRMQEGDLQAAVMAMNAKQ